MLQLAITRVLEIVGEAASRVTPPGRARYADIPWHDVINTRNRIIHGYDTVDYDIVWHILNDELPNDGGPFPRLCAKMATGSGKTPVMGARGHRARRVRQVDLGVSKSPSDLQDVVRVASH